MLKAFKNKTVISVLAGLLLSLAGVLIFELLPDSELANGIQYSASDAVGVLALSPILILVGGILFIIAMLKDIRKWKNTLPDVAIYMFIAGFIAATIINFAVSLSYFISQYSLGFVAPYDGLVYETFAVVMPVFVIWKLIFTVLTIADAVKENK